MYTNFLIDLETILVHTWSFWPWPVLPQCLVRCSCFYEWGKCNSLVKARSCEMLRLVFFPFLWNRVLSNMKWEQNNHSDYLQFLRAIIFLWLMKQNFTTMFSGSLIHPPALLRLSSALMCWSCSLSAEIPHGANLLEYNRELELIAQKRTDIEHPVMIQKWMEIWCLIPCAIALEIPFIYRYTCTI